MNNTRVILEDQETKNIYIELFKVIVRALKFTLYLFISFLELLIKIVKVLFNLNDYRPLQSFTEGRNSILNRIAQREINKEKIRFTSDYLGRHEYIFPRSDQFLNSYKEIQERLKDIADNNIKLNKELYKDTIKQINVLIVEAEKVAMKQAYRYAKETKYKLDETDVYDSFIQNKVMQGESNRKFKIEE